MNSYFVLISYPPTPTPPHTHIKNKTKTKNNFDTPDWLNSGFLAFTSEEWVLPTLVILPWLWVLCGVQVCTWWCGQHRDCVLCSPISWPHAMVSWCSNNNALDLHLKSLDLAKPVNRQRMSTLPCSGNHSLAVQWSSISDYTRSTLC